MAKQTVQVERIAERRIRLAIRVVSAQDAEQLAPREQDAIWKLARQVMGLPDRGLGEMGLGVHAPAEMKAAIFSQWRGKHVTELAHAQQHARDVFAAATSGADVPFSFKGEVTMSPRSPLSFRGTFQYTFPATVMWLLTESQVGRRVRKCPECSAYFIRVRRQIYCSDRCTDRALWRKYPARKKRAARRKQYEKHGWQLGRRQKGRTP
jgi:hypothetical protein